MSNPFTWDNLTQTPAAADVFSLPAMVFFVVFALGFVASAFLANQGARRFASHPVKRRGIQHCANIALYIFGAGLFFFGVRALNINPFSFGTPIWLWLSLVALVVLVIYCVRYWRTTYPTRLELYEARQLKQQYLKPKKAAAPSAPVRQPRAASAQKPSGTPPAS